MMELGFSTAVGALIAAGVYLLLRMRTFDVILGLTLLSYAVNVMIVAMGRLRVGAPPILSDAAAPTLANHADPLPQALVLTAIVIGFAMTAVLLVVAVRSRADNGSDHVDAREPEAMRGEAPPREDSA